MIRAVEQSQKARSTLNITGLCFATIDVMRNIRPGVIEMERIITMNEQEYLSMQYKAKQSEMNAVDRVYRSETGAHRLTLDVTVINLLIHGARAEDVLRDCVGIRIGGDV